jgi:hypothetical protein
MAHNTHKIGGDTTVAVAVITFASYTQGGEQFTLAEFGLSGTLQRLWILPSSGPGSEGQPVVEYVGGGLVKLRGLGQPASLGSELPTTASLNLQVLVVVTLVGS